MTEKVPQTHEKMRRLIEGILHDACVSTAPAEAITFLIEHWREAWLAEAASRLRRFDEAIPPNSVAAVASPDGWMIHRVGECGIVPGRPWILIERISDQSSIRKLAEDLGEPPTKDLHLYAVKANRLRRAVLEQEP